MFKEKSQNITLTDVKKFIGKIMNNIRAVHIRELDKKIKEKSK